MIALTLLCASALDLPGAPAWVPGLLRALQPEFPAMALRFVLGSLLAGLGMYLVIGGFLYRRYYVERRDDAARWKCQPQRFPTERLRRYDLRLGLLNLSVGSILSGLFAYYVCAGGKTGVFLTLNDARGGHGLAFAVVTGLVYFLLTDLGLYAAHRTFHRPRLFRAIHRFHHRNTTPTPFTAYAMHPLEFLTYEAITIVPLFFFPVHGAAVVATLLYSNYMALMQHSGVRMSFPLPWEPSTRFHDDHHLHFHVNYGQNLMLWDRVFGSLRRHGRRYGAEVFGGQGAALAGSEGAAPRYVDYRRDPRGSGEPAAEIRLEGRHV